MSVQQPVRHLFVFGFKIKARRLCLHRQQRGERMKRSRLSDIPGVGPKRVKDLLAHFHSIDAIQLASVDTLSKAPGVGPAMAKEIHDFFHPKEDEEAVEKQSLAGRA